jgi:hypothetical protein
MKKSGTKIEPEIPGESKQEQGWRLANKRVPRFHLGKKGLFKPLAALGHYRLPAADIEAAINWIEENWTQTKALMRNGQEETNRPDFHIGPH